MFIELTLKHLNVKVMILISSISFMYSFENGTRIHFIGDNLPLDCIEKYDEVRNGIITMEKQK